MATATKSRKSTPVRHQARVTKVVRDAAAETTNKIIAALKAGTVPWQQDWVGGIGDGLPVSLATGKNYRGANVVLLWMAAAANGYSSNRWGTYKQISERGGQVRKGEKSTEIIFWRIIEKNQTVDGKDSVKKIPLLRLFHVFNVDQADWAADAKLPKVTERTPVEAIEAAEALIADYLADGPSLGWGGDKAFYQPGIDHIQLPLREAFGSPEGLYSTLYHEATHSTGHSKRLAREGIAAGTFGAFGDKVYSNEELIAEIGAAILCAIAGIEQKATLDNSAAYIAHWISKLEEDPNLIIKAASAAQKAVDRIVGTTFDNQDEEE